MRPIKRINKPINKIVPIIVGARSAQKCMEEVSIILTVLSGALRSMPISLRESCVGNIAISVGEFSAFIQEKSNCVVVGAGTSVRVPITVKSRTSTILYFPVL